jgi:hypothetical protein
MDAEHQPQDVHQRRLPRVGRDRADRQAERTHCVDGEIHRAVSGDAATDHQGVTGEDNGRGQPTDGRRGIVDQRQNCVVHPAIVTRFGLKENCILIVSG